MSSTADFADDADKDTSLRYDTASYLLKGDKMQQHVDWMLAFLVSGLMYGHYVWDYSRGQKQLIDSNSPLISGVVLGGLSGFGVIALKSILESKLLLSFQSIMSAASLSLVLSILWSDFFWARKWHQNKSESQST